MSPLPRSSPANASPQNDPLQQEHRHFRRILLRLALAWLALTAFALLLNPARNPSRQLWLSSAVVGIAFLYSCLCHIAKLRRLSGR